MVANLLLNTNMSQSEILQCSGYKDRHTITRINQHKIYKDLLIDYPNPIRQACNDYLRPQAESTPTIDTWVDSRKRSQSNGKE